MSERKIVFKYDDDYEGTDELMRVKYSELRPGDHFRRPGANPVRVKLTTGYRIGDAWYRDRPDSDLMYIRVDEDGKYMMAEPEKVLLGTVTPGAVVLIHGDYKVLSSETLVLGDDTDRRYVRCRRIDSSLRSPERWNKDRMVTVVGRLAVE